jgi:hypothetical protein
MMAIDYEDFRADIGDANSAFSEAEIDKLETRATERWGADVAYEGARVLAVQQLLSNSAKRVDYTANESSEKRSQIFKNLQDMLKIFKDDLSDKQQELAEASSSNARFGGTVKKPSRSKEYPDA